MGMGLMDLIAASQGRGQGGGMGMMGMMPQTSAAPVGASVVKALLAKHGITAPANVPGGGDAPSVAPATPAMVPPAPAPVSLDTAPAAPITAPAPALAAADVSIKKPGMFSRIGDFLKSDEGKAEMMRFAAGAFNGGLGGGLTAATNFADERHHQQAEATAEAQKLALEGQKINNSYNLGLWHLGIEGETVGETARHNRVGEANDQFKTRADYAGKQMETGEKHFEHITPSGDAALTQQGENARWGTPSANVQLSESAANNRSAGNNQATIEAARLGHPENMGFTQTVTKNDGTDPGWFSSGKPNTTITTTRAPSQVTPNMGTPGGATKISSDQEYAALPSGARFMGPDNQIRIKP